MNIRPADIGDIDEILSLFYDTITSICSNDYNKYQIAVWASSANNRQKWVDRLSKQYFLVAELRDQIVGFGSIEKGEYLDLLYVHKDFQNRGAGKSLLIELEYESQKLNKPFIYANVSITAKPFFEKHGFRLVKEQKNLVKDIEIINFRMIKEKQQTNITPNE